MGELGEFLRSRRRRIGPAQVGLPTGIRRRQTPGLRREELAALAGMSVDYYIRLEQGRDTRPSAAILDALARALRLDDDERKHLYDLASHAAGHPAQRPVAGPVSLRPGLGALLEAVRPTPGYVLDRTSSVLAANPEGLALLPGLDSWPPQQRNLVRYVFVHPAAQQVFAAWPAMAEDCVAHLRTVEATEPGSTQLDTLVTELNATSPSFAKLWRHYDVRVKSGSRRAFQHPLVGRFELTSEILTTVDGQRFVVFQAPPGSPDHDALQLLSLTTNRTRRRAGSRHGGGA
jgi:transcriptional regulator with XRE-family HTH domain